MCVRACVLVMTMVVVRVCEGVAVRSMCVVGRCLLCLDVRWPTVVLALGSFLAWATVFALADRGALSLSIAFPIAVRAPLCVAAVSSCPQFWLVVAVAC
jgi:hypothetical protein